MQLYQLTFFMAAIAAALALVVWLAWRSARAKPDASKSGDKSGHKFDAGRIGFLKIPRRTRPDTVEPEQAEPAPERRRKLQPASVTEAAERASIQANALAFSEEIFSKLEQAFEAYQRQGISLETYSSLIMAEQQAVERHIGELRAGQAEKEPSPDQAVALADAESAREAVRWCIDWACDLSRDGKQAAG